MKENKIKNVFISHHGKDDEHISKLKDLLDKNGYTLRNSSIDSSKPNEAKKPDYVKSLLRPRMEWAGTTIVLIGNETHSREWVNWEIEYSNRLGNRIVGVFLNGASDSDVPEAFHQYGDALVGWTSVNIIAAIEGKNNTWEGSNGGTWQSPMNPSRSTC